MITAIYVALYLIAASVLTYLCGYIVKKYSKQNDPLRDLFLTGCCIVWPAGIVIAGVVTIGMFFELIFDLGKGEK